MQFLPITTRLQRLLLPFLTGLVIALSILLWAPEWILPSPAAPLPTIQQGANRDAPVSYANAVEQAAPAVVNIYTRKRVQRHHPLFDDPFFQRFFDAPQANDRVQSSLGSGVIMSANGYVLTNYHVISGADEIVVALRDGREANARLIGTDPEVDLAVLRIELTDLPFIHVTSNRSLSVGDVVLAIGNPFGVGQTVTMGIISATGRNQLGLNTYENYLQTDAAINPGNSGGALINAYGELVGINTAIFSKSGGSEGIGFAIPSDVATRVLTDIARHGSTIRGWLGIEVREANPELLASIGLPSQLSGLVIMGVTEQGPAAQAGLQIGDIVLQINGNNAQNARTAMNQIAALRPGDGIRLTLLREGQVQEITATAGRRLSQTER
ncbi:MAG: trypsin-like peptidase domain-containing protein [Bacterioplanes sp.]|nr:trypsin-like peptidase domain-containing protein [Bacterioplanes sp.]